MSIDDKDDPLLKRFVTTPGVAGHTDPGSATAVPQVSMSAVFAPGEPFEYWLKANLREFPVTLDLPESLRLWIARIVTHWAVAEWLQAGILARVLRLSRKEARVMFGDRIGNCTSKIKQALEMKDCGVPASLEGLSELLTKCERARNLMAHGVWMHDPGTGEVCVQNPAGEWTVPKQPAVSKRKYPEAFFPTEAWLTKVLQDIETAIKNLQSLDQDIACRLDALPGKGASTGG